MGGVLGYYKLLDESNRLIIKKDKRKESYARVLVDMSLLHDFVVCLMCTRIQDSCNARPFYVNANTGRGLPE